ncbi:MAG: hypothetical protein ACK52X_03145, partial [bacterium]
MLDFQRLLDDFDYLGYDSPAGELKKLLETTKDEAIKHQIQIEIDCLNFSFSEGKLLPMFSTADKSGLNIYEYQTLKSFTDEAFKYII